MTRIATPGRWAYSRRRYEAHIRHLRLHYLRLPHYYRRPPALLLTQQH